ncbi:MAG: GTPase HflX [Verrucomicrobia bacterium]|nr:GTPase HflX [Verrucomicrobiota bacterium]
MNNVREIKTLGKALLVGYYLRNTELSGSQESLEELERLADTFGLETVEKIPCPLKKIVSATLLGEGKLEELFALCEEYRIDMVIFDDEISPQQQRNLEKIFKRPVLDRTELILEVFAQRAQTKEAKLQIELAKIRYEMPRLKRMWTHLSRQVAGGGGFTKGAGEKQIELDRRMLRHRVERLQKEIEEVRAHRQIQRSARIRTGIPTFAIVGYTNAGKSTLLKALTQADVLVEDKLFATLDTTTRKYILPNNQQILLVDTVGFIRKIPHTLIAAFKSTLEEAIHTDVLLHLIDASSPQAMGQAEATIKVLEELGVADQQIITVLNKIDQCENQSNLQKLRLHFPHTVQISALEQRGFPQLMAEMIKAIEALRKKLHLCIPQSHYALVSELMRDGRVISIEYEENDVVMEVEIPARLELKVGPFIR